MCGEPAAMPTQVRCMGPECLGGQVPQLSSGSESRPLEASSVSVRLDLVNWSKQSLRKKNHYKWELMEVEGLSSRKKKKLLKSKQLHILNVFLPSSVYLQRCRIMKF